MQARSVWRISVLVPVVGACIGLATMDLLGLWRQSEASALVRWSVLATGALLTGLIVAAYVWISLGRDDAFALRVRTRGALIGGAGCLILYGTPLFRVVADTLGTFAGLLLGLFFYVFSRFFGV